MAVFAILIGVLGVAFIAMFVWSLLAILTTPESTWEAAGMNQWMWLAVVIFLPLVGSVLFVAVARPALVGGDREPIPSKDKVAS